MTSVMTLDFLAVKGHFIIFYLKCLRQKLIFFIIFKSKVNHFRKIKVLSYKRNSSTSFHYSIYHEDSDTLKLEITQYSLTNFMKLIWGILNLLVLLWWVFIHLVCWKLIGQCNLTRPC